MSMINIYEVNETNNMIEHEKLDVRTIIMPHGASTLPKLAV